MKQENRQAVAERAILGALLRSDTAFWSVSDVLIAAHFGRPIHQQIYAAVADLYRDGRRVTVQSIVARIGDEFDDGMSVPHYLGAMMIEAEASDEPSTWRELVEMIVDGWRARQAIGVASGLKTALAKPGAIAEDVISDAVEKLVEIRQTSNTEPVKWIGSIAQNALFASSKARQTGDLGFFDTGIPGLDEILGAIHPGDLGFILAAPGDGKSLLGAQMAMRTARRVPAAYFQLEMSADDMARRALAGLSNMSVAEIEEGNYDFVGYETLQDARAKLEGIRLCIDDRPKLRIEQIYDRVRTLKATTGLGMIVVDHLRLVRTAVKVRDKFERAELVTGDLKAMAKELRIAVVCLSQVTRSSQRRDDPTPQRSDGDGGSSIEQDADWALAMLRRDRWMKTQRPVNGSEKDWEEWESKLSKHRGRVEITVLKRRRGEDGEMREFWFDGRQSLIRDIER